MLYRINSQSEELERALEQLGIAYQLRGGERFFARPEIRSAVQLIRAEALSPSGKPLDHAVSDIVRSLGWQQQRPTQQGAVASKWEALNALLSMVDELPDGAGLKEFALELADRAHSQHEPTQDAVTLSTIHAAKGLEWPMVFIIGLNEGYLPITYAKSEQAIQEAVRAGNDLVMICHRLEMVELARQHLEGVEGPILHDALTRIQKIKKRLVRPDKFDLARFQAINNEIWDLRVATLGEEAARNLSVEDGKRSPVELY